MASAESPDAATSPRFKTVFVLGLAHCGSTLLGRMLGMHPAVLSVGELMRLGPAVERDALCTCGAVMSQCPFWAPRLASLREETRLDYRRFGLKLYTDLAHSAGRQMAFDVSKTLVWKRTRWWRNRGEGYVLLVRDTRGLMASALRKERDLSHLLKKHVKWMRRLSSYARRRGERALVMHYEDLCREPERELRRLCAFMGLPFTPELLRPADGVHHLVHSSTSGYLKGTNDIRLDERWRKELSPEHLTRIEDAMERLDVFRGRFERASAARSEA
jgi:hypothetical protein